MIRRALAALVAVLGIAGVALVVAANPAYAGHGQTEYWEPSPCNPPVWWIAHHVHDVATGITWDGVKYTEDKGIWGWSGPFRSWGPMHDGYASVAAQCGRLGAPTSELRRVHPGKWVQYYRGGEATVENFTAYGAYHDRYCWCPTPGGVVVWSVRYY